MGYMGSYYSIPKAIFYLLKGDYRVESMSLSFCRLRRSRMFRDVTACGLGCRVYDFRERERERSRF